MPVHLKVDDGIATLTIDRPRALNALDRETLEALRDHVAELHADPPAVVVVESTGERVFVAGADIAAMSAMSVEQARAFARLGHATFDALEALPSIVLAAVQGAALGGGCELVLACDLILSSDTARFGQPETNLGLIPGFGGCGRLLRRVGVALARDLIYSGRLLTAAEALAAGLVSRVVAAADLREETGRWAGALAGRPPLALRRAKEVLAVAESADARSAARVEIEGFAGLFAADDTREGLAAFLENRPPRCRGC